MSACFAAGQRHRAICRSAVGVTDDRRGSAEYGMQSGAIHTHCEAQRPAKGTRESSRRNLSDGTGDSGTDHAKQQADADEQRISSLASLNEQCARNQKRLAKLEVEIARYGRPAPNRVAILRAVQDLETLWEKMTTAERSRFMHTLIERIDHDPHEGEIEIKLSETGLQLLGDATENIEESDA